MSPGTMRKSTCRVTVYGWTRVPSRCNSGLEHSTSDIQSKSREFAWQRSLQKFPSASRKSLRLRLGSESQDDATPKSSPSFQSPVTLADALPTSWGLATTQKSGALSPQPSGLAATFGIQRRSTGDDEVLEALTRPTEGAPVVEERPKSGDGLQSHRVRQSSHRLNQRGNIYDMAFLFGTKILIDPKQLETTKRLGEGSFSVVLRGVLKCEDGTMQDVAVKRIRTRVSQRSGEVAAFIAEAHVLANLNSSFVPRCIGLGSVTGKADAGMFVVQDFLEGGNLNGVLRAEARSPLRQMYSLRRSLRWMIQLASALDYLHTLRPIMVIHRDVKSANVLMTSMRPELADCKLGDFGLHKQVDFRLVSSSTIDNTFQRVPLEVLLADAGPGVPAKSGPVSAPLMDTAHAPPQRRRASNCVAPDKDLRRSSWVSGFLRMSASATDSMALCCFTKMCGSLLFMAPEVFSGGVYDEKVDVFSFAMVCYEVAIRKPLALALGLKSHQEMLHVAEEVSCGWRPPLPKFVHPRLSYIIEHCWCHIPQQRWTATRALAELQRLHDDLDAQSQRSWFSACCGL